MPKDADPRECSIADTLDLVGERWSLLAIRELSYGVRRFDQIVYNTGASRDILTSRLRKLEANGIIRRERYSDHPARYEYHLTPAGVELCDVLLVLMAWGDRHLHPDDPPVQWQHSCGEPVNPLVICRYCGNEARQGAHSPTGRGARTA
ncbi:MULTISPECIES: winged helix-turn-helix transcriptional regulator [Actinomadura]|uniref:DNA-binding transcriptional regulator, HxlR family n=1 Tax=Actinomadura madurae TaxID=1993 RepID=A0A1I5QC18_9ACTN|nr:helix-turn-helix domain-containing protein [Actinomadura madurae]MCP9953699.1 helix-turn-helix transcriptional regulator [Actinomadura madurae]MCP9970455.1 helix-turn-helix transcriptional regulator [Actinomadura madurae]MCP9982936.1 helix-turn-helix transcriptional regulator [Actinomadura madurae]MCQ0005516.1 helix-turn-helix transcriptional regulator [Actinomadura madurae]MCQ0019170.1 helix-turn-helix transcriptional regulator [Actinomadura madurae]